MYPHARRHLISLWAPYNGFGRGRQSPIYFSRYSRTSLPFWWIGNLEKGLVDPQNQLDSMVNVVCLWHRVLTWLSSMKISSDEITKKYHKAKVITSCQVNIIRWYASPSLTISVAKAKEGYFQLLRAALDFVPRWIGSVTVKHCAGCILKSYPANDYIPPLHFCIHFLLYSNFLSLTDSSRWQSVCIVCS
jgi:hypothetical protein